MTKDGRRYQAICHIGCIACIKVGIDQEPCQVHHLNKDGKAGQERRGNQETIGLCPWHHQGQPGNMTQKLALWKKGPSLALHPRGFRERFGTDDELLEMENKLIEQREKFRV